MNLTVNQNDILQAIRQDGGEAIQTADGLLVKSERNSLADLLANLNGGSSITAANVSPDDDGLTPDMIAFMRK